MKRLIMIVLMMVFPFTAFAQTPPLAMKTFFAHWAQQSGVYRSEIEIKRTVPLPGTATITFYRSDGVLLQRVPVDLGTRVSAIVSAPESATLITGAAIVESADIRFDAKLVYHYPFGDEVIFSDEERGAFVIDVELNRATGLNTGVAIFNSKDRRLKVTANLKDPNSTDKNGEPTILDTKSFNLESHQQVSRFVDQDPLFGGFFANRASFRGVVEFVVSDPQSDQTNFDTQVIAMNVRWLSFPDGRYNFSSSPVRPLPYWNPQTFKNSAFNAVYFCAKDCESSSDYDANYERHFRELLATAQRYYGDESERMGFARRTFDVAHDADGQIRIERMTGNLNVAGYMLPNGKDADCNKIHNEIKRRHSAALPVVFIAVPSNWDGATGANGCLAMQGTTTSLAEAKGLKSFDYLRQLDRVTENDVAMFALGTSIHELGHNFGLPHTYDFDNDQRTKGLFENIMGGSTGNLKMALAAFPDLRTNPLVRDPRRFWNVANPSFAASEVVILKKSALLLER